MQKIFDMDPETIQLVTEILRPETREQAIAELSKRREPTLAPILWNSFGIIAVFLQEIISIYPLLHNGQLTTHLSNRVCNTLSLLQLITSTEETKNAFVSANLAVYIYPFLTTSSSAAGKVNSNFNNNNANKPYEYLKLTALGVIGGLVKHDDPDDIKYLLSTDIVPMCLKLMESSAILSKSIATFIIAKIIHDDIGLDYMCQTPERFAKFNAVLSKTLLGHLAHIEKTQLNQMQNQNSQNQTAAQQLTKMNIGSEVRLLRHVVMCFARLAGNQKSRDMLRRANTSMQGQTATLLEILNVETNLLTLKEAFADDREALAWVEQLVRLLRT